MWTLRSLRNRTSRLVSPAARIVTACLLLSGYLSAQVNEPRVEVFGGYSILRPNLPADFLTIDGEPGEQLGESVLGNVLGWGGSVTVNLTRTVGVTADFGGHYRSLEASIEGSSAEVSADLHTFLFGPTLTMRQERVNPFVHALFGVGRVGGSGTFDSVTEDLPSETGFAASVGGGVDIDVNGTIGVRAIEFDYYPYRQGDGETFTFNNVRWRSGIVVRFE